jgi:hypothetical protein
MTLKISTTETTETETPGLGKTTVSERKPKFGLEHHLGCAVLSVFFCSGVFVVSSRPFGQNRTEKNRKSHQEPIRARGGVGSVFSGGVSVVV